MKEAIRSGADGHEILRRTHAHPSGFMSGYGWFTVGLHEQTASHRADFLIAKTNMYCEDFVDVFVIQRPPLAPDDRDR